MASAHFIKKIAQKDNYTFCIEWNDGVQADYRLSDIQKHCPCAACNEKPPSNFYVDVRAKRIYSVGRYALKIEFTSGCSAGIYDFDFLRTAAGLS